MVFIKTLALAGIATLLLTSCGDMKTAKKADDNAPVEISILISQGSDIVLNSQQPVIKEIERRLGVTLNLICIPSSDYQEKRNIILNSGQMPDIITNVWADEISRFAVNGMILPISDYEDKLTEFKRRVAEWGLDKEIDGIRELDNKFYILPALSPELKQNDVYIVNKELFEENGMKIPDSLEELYGELVILKGKYPDLLAFGDMYNGDQFLSVIAESFDTNGGWSLPYLYSYNYETGEWYFAPTSSQYFNLVSYLKKLADAKLLSEDLFTQDMDLYLNKFCSGKYAVTTGTAADKSRYKSYWADRGQEKTVDFMLPPAGPDGTRMTKPASRISGGVALSAEAVKKPYFDKILQFCDWLYYSDEAAQLTKVGIEGVTYHAENGELVFNNDIQTRENNSASKTLTNDFGCSIMGLSTLVSEAMPEKYYNLFQNSLYTDEDIRFFDELGSRNMIALDDPILKFTNSEANEVRTLIASLKEYTKPMLIKFIYGAESMDKWQEYEQRCRELGSERLVEIARTAWERQNK